MKTKLGRKLNDMKKLKNIVKQWSRKTYIIIGLCIIMVCGVCIAMFYQNKEANNANDYRDGPAMFAFVEKVKDRQISVDISNLKQEEAEESSDNPESMETEVDNEQKADSPVKETTPKNEGKESISPPANAPTEEEKPIIPTPEPKPDEVKPEVKPTPLPEPKPEEKPAVVPDDKVCPTSGLADEGSYYEEFFGVTVYYKDFYSYEESMAFGLTLEPQSIRYNYTPKDVPLINQDTGCKIWSIDWQKR